MSASLKTIQTLGRSVIGLFLLATAALKAHGLVVDPLNSELHGIPSLIQFVAIEVEVLLGLWLLSGLKPTWALLGTLGFFSIVTGVAAKQVFDRQSSCACFGKFEVNPSTPWFSTSL